jgi:pyruvate dehydrogenase E2 component (dihydrolipoamide acetyltransferase)
MANDVIIPRIGWSMEKGVFIEWLKKEGDAIAVGDALFLIEADKANAEVVSEEAGVLHIFPGRAKQGDELMVGTVIGCLLDAGEALPGDVVPAGDSLLAKQAEIPDGGPNKITPEPGTGTARGHKDTFADQARLAQPRKVISAMPSGLPKEAPGQKSRIISSPRARRVSRELGVDMIGLAGSGKGGRIVERDVRTAVTALEREQVPEHPVNRASNLSTIRLTEDATELMSLFGRLRRLGTDDHLAPGLYRGLLVKLAISAYQHSFDASKAEARTDIAYGSLVDERISWKSLCGNRRKGLDELALELNSGEGKAGNLSGLESFAFIDLDAFGVDEYIPGTEIPSNLLVCFGRLIEGETREGGQSRIRTLKISISFEDSLISFLQASRFLKNLGSALLDPVLWLL